MSEIATPAGAKTLEPNPPAQGAPAADAATRPRTAEYFLPAPAMLLVALFLLAPLALMLRYSVDRFVPGEALPGVFTLENYKKFFTDEFYQRVLWTTIWVSVVTTVLCLIMGLPLSYYISRLRRPRLKSALIILVILPLLLGNGVRTAGWMVLLGDRGLVNSLLVGLHLVSDHLTILYTPTAVVIGLTSVLLPFMIITLQSVIEGIDPSIEEASLNLGAGPLTTFRHVVIPLAMPGVVAGTTLCFILSMNAYATPVLIGGPKFFMMAPTIYDQVTQSANWPFGAALAFVLMVVTGALTLATAFLIGRRARR